jgi:phosphatidylserine/phosphatidylglycerophosphate/cardiolipin synthase-like enzyme
MEGFKMMADAKGLAVQLHQKEELHAKGLVGDSFALNGSMNFTFNGITVNEEELNYYTDPTAIAERKIILTERWGGVKP